jgi:hypothetical protein
MVDTPESKQPAKKRRWFQFHLSTLVLLTLVASCLLWLNVRVDPATVVQLPYVPPGSDVMFSPPEGPADARGWPWYYHLKPEVFMWYEWHCWALLGDLAVLLATLLAAAVLIERAIRRRERRT